MMNSEKEILFSNETIDIDTLPKFEEVEFTSLHPHYRKVLLISLLLNTLILLLIVSFPAFSMYAGEWQILLFYIPILLFQLVHFFLLNKIIASRQYAIREKDILYRYGLLNRQTIVIPYNKIQHVAIQESWLARKYLLAKIVLFTTGDSLSIPGLTKETAQSIQALILKKIKEKETTETTTMNDEIPSSQMPLGNDTEEKF